MRYPLPWQPTRLPRSTRKRVDHRRLRLDSLEDRTAPAANVWVTNESSSGGSQQLREFSPTGTLLSSRFIPVGSTDGNARDLAVDADGNVHVYNGTFTAYVATYNPATGTWQQHTAPGLSQANVTFFGGIAATGNYVFAPDYSTGDANGNNPESGLRGLVRFNRTDWSFTRFAEGFDLHDVTVGQDGKVYALDYYRTVYVYDPDTLAAVRSFQVPNTIGSEWAEPRGIAVNAAGEVYVVHSNDTVARYTPDGVMIDKVRVGGAGSGAPAGFYAAYDIDISPDGTQLAVGSDGGHVVLLNSLLGDVRYFSAGTSGSTFVTFGRENGPVLPGIAVIDTTVNEGDDGPATATFTARLSIPSTETVTADWATSDGTAIAGTDYQASTGTVTFAPGELFQTITVPVTGDRLREANETFRVTLSNPSANARLFRAQATGTVADDDPPVVQRTLASYGYARDYQGDGTFEYFVRGSDPTRVLSDPAAGSGQPKAERSLFEFDLSGLAGDPVGVVSLELNLQSVAPGSQPIEVWGFAGNGLVEQADAEAAAVLLGTFAPPAYGHASVRLDRDAVMGLVGQSNFLGLRLAASAPTTKVEVRSGVYNYDPTKLVFFQGATPVPAASITDVTVTEGNPFGTTVVYRDMTFTITLSQASTEPVSLGVGTQFLTATYNTDYEWPAGVTPVTFNPGETVKAVTARARGDALDEPDETFYMQLLTPNGMVVADGLGLGTIVDDDPLPTLTVANASVTEGASGEQLLAFRLQLSAASGKPISVDFSTSNNTATAGTDYAATAGTATISPGSTNTTLYVRVFGDTVYEGPSETFYLNLTNPVNVTLGTARATGTITEDESFPSFSASSPTVTEAASGTVTFTVSISTASYQTVRVNYATEDETATAGLDYAAATGALTFAPGETTKTVPVSVNPDVAQEGRETFRLRFSSPSGATLWYPTTFATILDEDTTEQTAGTAAHGHIQDVGGDGFETVVNAPYSVEVRNLTYIPSGNYAKESRGLFEFNLAAVQASPNEIIQARFEFYVNGLSGQTGVAQPVSVYGYAANGSIEMADLTAPGVLLGTFDANANGGTGRRYVNLDAAAVAGLLDTTALVGLRLEGAAGSNFSIAGPAASGLTPPTLIFALGDPPVVPAVSVDDTADPEGNAASGPAGFVDRAFTVRLSEPTTVPVTVQYATADGSAVSGAAAQDFEAATGSVTFQPGEVSKSVTVRVRGDNTYEPDESFLLRLTGATNGTVADGEAVATLTNDDAVPRLVLAGYGFIEGDDGSTQFAYTVSLSNPTYQEVRVNWATADGTATAGADYQAASGTAVIPAGGSGTYFLVTLLNDTLDEDYEEQFYLAFADAVNATLPADPRATITVIDNESLPGISVSDVTVVEGDTDTRNAVFTLTLDGVSPLGANYPPSVVVETADGTATAGSDYTALAPRTVSFPYGTTSATVSVPVLGDLLYEPDETFTLKLSGVRFGHIADPDRAALATITNDDMAVTVNAADIAVDEGSVGQTTDAVFTVSLSGPSSQTVTVDYRVADGTARADDADYTVAAASGTLTFAPGETSKTVTVQVRGDSTYEPDETFALDLSNATGAALGIDGTGTIRNDDARPAVATTARTVTEGNSGTAPMTFAVTLSNPSYQSVTVDYATADGTARAGSDYTGAGGTLTFAPGETSKSVTVDVVGDRVYEGDEQFAFNLSNPGNATVGTPSVTGTITDDDRPTVSAANAAVDEGDTGATSLVFTLTLSNPSVEAVTVDYATADGTARAGSDYTAAAGSVTFAPGETSKTMAVAVTAETDLEPDETLDLRLSLPAGTNATLDTPTAVGTIRNDDFAPVANAGADQTANEGAAVRFDGSGSSDADGDPLSYSWDFGDGGTGTGVNPTHTYADNGTFTVTLTVSDGHGGSSTDTAVVTVRNVAPVAGVGGPATGARGQARTFTLSADDVSAADRAAPFGYRIDWGDGTTGTASGPAAGTPVAHAYTAAGTYTVRVWATDKDGAEGAVASWSHTIKVVEVQGTDLVIGGTTGNDTILVTATPTANTVTVAINGASQGTFTAAGQLVVYAQAGDDKVSFATRKVSGTTYFTSQPLLLFGEAGNDTLDARNAIGAAVLVGGAGNDVLWGSRGRTILIGGAGADDARGGDAEDVVIGGATSYDADPTGLAALRAEWARTDAGYATRRDRLLGVQGGGFNGAYVLSAAGPSPTVQDDGGQADTLFGYGGQDWYFAAATDRLGDRQSNETVTGL